MHLPRPARAPKSQLAIEQSSTGECWNPPEKDTPHPKTKKKLQWDSRRSAIMKNQIPYLLGGWPTNWRTIIPKNFSHCCEGSDSHGWEGPNKGSGNPQGIWLWSTAEFYCKTSIGLRETDFRLGGHKQNLVCTKSQKKGAVAPQETGAKLPASIGGPPVEVWVSRGTLQRQGNWQQLSGKVSFGINTLGGHH